MNAIESDLGRRAHHVVRVIIEALPIAVAMDRDGVSGAGRLGDITVEITSLLRVDADQFFPAGGRGGELARIELIVRVKGALDLAQLLIQLRPKKRGAVFTSKALAVFGPEHAAVAFYQRHYLVADLTQ